MDTRGYTGRRYPNPIGPRKQLTAEQKALRSEKAAITRAIKNKALFSAGLKIIKYVNPPRPKYSDRMALKLEQNAVLRREGLMRKKRSTTFKPDYVYGGKYGNKRSGPGIKQGNLEYFKTDGGLRRVDDYLINQNRLNKELKGRAGIGIEY